MVSLEDSVKNALDRLTTAMEDAANQVAAEIVTTAPTPVVEESGFKYSTSSKKHREGVRSELIEVADLALKLSTIDMIILKDGGLRTEETQRKLVQRGVSKTMNSKHRTGDAIDLNAYKNGAVSWDWNDYYLIAMAVDKAATELGYADKLKWGGAWDRTLADFGGEASAYAKVVADYCVRHPGKDFIDGPHFEWIR